MRLHVYQRTFLALLICEFQLANLGNPSAPDVAFPPPAPHENPPDLGGHLKPFGCQRVPKGPLIEYNEVLQPTEFWERHVSRTLPLVFRGGIAQSPAIEKWTDENLKLNFGDLDVLVEAKKENRTHGFTERMLFAAFLERYETDNLYAVTVLPDPMRKDVQALPCLLCGTFREFIHETNFWMGFGGTRSVVHFDADHNLHCIVAGQKDFMMVDPTFADAFKITKPEESGSGFSLVDPDAVDLNLYPKLAEVEWTYARLGPGDCIYIPSGYLHQVRSHVRSVSVTTLFTASTHNNFSPTGCAAQPFAYTSLAEVDVMWTYNKGDRFIAMGYMNVETFRGMFRQHIEARSDGKMNAQEFNKFVEKLFPLVDEDMAVLKRDTEEIYATLLDTGARGYITAGDVKRFTKKTLKAVIARCEDPHGPPEEGYGDGESEDRDLGRDEL